MPTNNELILVPTGAVEGAMPRFDGTRWQHNAYVPYQANDFRLTLTTGVAVTTADVIGATTIYMTPYKGDRISFYTGAYWKTFATAEISLAVGTLTSGLPYDIFAYDNAGVAVELEAVAWTNGTTRATALVRQDGVWCKTGDLTRRYVGTFYTTATTTTEDSAAKRFLFNADNRVRRAMRVIETTDSWTYTTDVWRSANNSNANALQFIRGLAEDMVFAQVFGVVFNSAGAPSASVGIGVDSTSVNSADCFHGNGSNTVLLMAQALYRGYPGVGYHYLQWLERCGATGTQYWYGDSGIETMQCGIVGEVES